MRNERGAVCDGVPGKAYKFSSPVSKCSFCEVFVVLARRFFVTVRVRNKKTLSRVRCLAAGIFLGTLFLGLMPAVRSAVQVALLDAPFGDEGTAPTSFPVAEAMVFVGFCATLYLESLLMAMGRRNAAASHCTPTQAQQQQGSPGSSDTDLIDSPKNSWTKLLTRGAMQGQHPAVTMTSSSQHDIVAVPSSYDLVEDGQDSERPTSAAGYRLAML
ncbi:hypothetical protein V5799_027110, partial [Amblyomma americanum]